MQIKLCVGMTGMMLSALMLFGVAAPLAFAANARARRDTAEVFTLSGNELYRPSSMQKASKTSA